MKGCTEKVSSFVLGTSAQVELLRKQANAPGESDELQGSIESLAIALKLGIASLPLTLSLLSPPNTDAMIFATGKPLLGVEVTRVGWQRSTHVRSVATRAGDHIVEFGVDLLVDKPGRRDKGTPQGNWTGDFAAIRKPGEELRGAGLLGDESRDRSVAALRTAIERKKPKLKGYLASVDRVWLFLIADGLVHNWDDILTRPDLASVRRDVETICAASGFDRVLLLAGSREVVALT
jgi:hypothetical protein